MSGYDETNPEAYRSIEPEVAADDTHPGIDSWPTSSQASSVMTSSVSEGIDTTEDRGSYADLSQAYTADASQPGPSTSWLLVEPPASQLPTEQIASLCTQPAQGQYQPQQPFYQSQQQSQGQYPVPTVRQVAPSSYSSVQQPYQGQQVHPGSPYTSTPTTSGGYASAGAPTGEPFYAASKATGVDSGTTRHRWGPGWFALVASVLAASLLGAGGAVGAIRVLDTRNGGAPQCSTVAPIVIATGSTTRAVSSAGQASDQEATSTAVSNAVASIGVVTDRSETLGSRVIFDKERHIIIDNHVVVGTSKIQAALADGCAYDAETTGTDPTANLAVTQFKDTLDSLTVAQLGDSDKLAASQDIMAIGNPLGLSLTVTAEIVSALNRSAVSSQNENGSGGSAVCTNAIQIDVAINPDNPGEPSSDEKGWVIGIISSAAVMSCLGGNKGGSGSIGIDFAIPIRLADKVTRQFIKSGVAMYTCPGVSLDTAGTMADGEERAGAKITSVEGESSADKAGLKKDDVAIAIDGKTTAQGSVLTSYVRQYSVSDEVKFAIIRDSKKQDIDTTLAERKGPRLGRLLIALPRPTAPDSGAIGPFFLGRFQSGRDGTESLRV